MVILSLAAAQRQQHRGQLVHGGHRCCLAPKTRPRRCAGRHRRSHSSIQLSGGSRDARAPPCYLRQLLLASPAHAAGVHSVQARGESDEGCRRVAGCVPWRWARREDQGATAAATSVATPNTGANSRVAPLPSRLGSGHAPGVAERRCIGRSDSPLAGLALAAVGAGAAPLGGAARQLECHVQMPQHAASVLAKLSTSADVASCDARTPRLAHWLVDAAAHGHGCRTARVTRLAWQP